MAGTDLRNVAPGDWAARLDALKGLADPDVDPLIEALREDAQLSEPGPLMRAAVDALEGRDTPLSARLRLLAPAVPDWGGDRGRIERGQKVFNDHALAFAAALFFASLPIAYATPEGARVLKRTSQLAGRNLTRRIAHTGQMLLDVTSEPSALERGGQGYSTAIGLRVLHSCVRAIVGTEDAPPLNQKIMLATLLDFTVVPWRALERLGVVLTTQERDDYAYLWSIVGALMGINACQARPLTSGDLEGFQTSAIEMLGESDEGKELMKIFLAEMEELMPLGWRKAPRSLVRFLFEGAPPAVAKVPTYLALDDEAWWSRPLLSALRSTSAVTAPLRAFTRMLTRRAGRNVLVGYVDKFAMNEKPPFRIPPDVIRLWAIRSKAPIRAVAVKRLAARTTVRAAGNRIRAVTTRERDG